MSNKKNNSNRLYKENAGYIIFQTSNYLLLFFLCMITVIPVYQVFSMSIRPEIDIIKYGQTILPQRISFEAFKEIFAGDKISRAFIQTLQITIFGTGISLVCNILTAYPLSKVYLPYNRIISFLIYFTMLFSGGLIPYYLVVTNIGLKNTIWAIIWGGAINPFNVIMFRNFFAQLPDSLLESPKIDGASEITILMKFVLPLSTPVIATLLLMTGVGFWNEWFSALIFLNDAKKWPLQLVLRDILQAGLTKSFEQMTVSEEALRPGESLKMAVVVVSTLPIMCVYPFLQKYFIRGLTMGAVKE